MRICDGTSLVFYREQVDRFKETHPAIPSNGEKALRLRRMIGGRGNASVLEIGAGYGKDISHLIDAGFVYTGIDSSAEMVAEIRRDHPEVVSAVQNATHLQFPDKSFDAVWASSVYHHILPSDIKQAFGELYRVLKPEGVAFIRIRTGGDYCTIDTQRNLQFFHYSQEHLVDELTKAGFTIEESSIVMTTKEQSPPHTPYMELYMRKPTAITRRSGRS